jgi:hypothetical protein
MQIKNRLHFIKGQTAFVSAQNDREALKLVSEHLQKHMKEFSTTGDVRCGNYPSYQVDIYKM